jgi:small subunit ribosomal protein S1
MANETINDPRLEEGVWTTDPESGELVPDYESTFPTIEEGQVVNGTVVRVDKDEVLVDIGYKSEGVIPVSELSIRRSINPEDEVALGDEVAALVLTKEDAEGRLILSKKRARFEIAWKAIETAHEQGDPVTGRVIEVVKGGLILDLGVRGFLPASLVDIRRVQDLDEFLGQELECKVIELNRSRNNVVLSRRAVLEEERKEQRQRILDRLNPGDVVEGTISNIVDFGAFVDLDGMDGLIHISELSWSHVNHPSEVLEIGQTVRVQVLDIDRERQRISLGLKQTQTDPWQQVLDSYQESDVVQGTVTKVVTFGAFVEILPGVEGLVHISELAQHHVENPREIVSQGDKVNVRILEVDAERRRLSLSLKRVEDGMPIQPKPGEEGEPPALGLSDEVFADEVPAAEALEVPAAEALEVPAAEEPEVAAEEPEVAAEETEVAPEEPEGAVEETEVAAEEPEPAAEVEAVEEEPATAEVEPEVVEEPVAEAEPQPEPEAEADEPEEPAAEAEAPETDASDEAAPE